MLSAVSANVVRVPRVTELAVGEAAVFEFQRGGHREEGFVLRHPKGFSAFVNRCPHWLVDLDLGDGRFYDNKIDRIYCKTHGALFLVDTGVCEYGPCAGSALEGLTLRLDGDDALVEVPRSLAIL